MGLLHVVRSVGRRIGIDARRFPDPRFDGDHRLALLVASLDVDLVLDVGASVGDFCVSLRSSGYRGRMVSFEPLAGSFNELQARAQADPGWTAVQTAVGSETGTASLFVAGNSVSSSIREMLPNHVDAAPTSRVIGEQQVEVVRLDDWMNENAPDSSRILLKLDTQGHEASALAGASATLDSCVSVHIEVSFKPLYAGAPTYLEVLASLDELGFRPCAVTPVLVDPTSGLALQADVTLIRD
jgi:FkbM family methyltransferase